MDSDDRQNYFELFGIEPTFQIDKPTVETAYLKLQRLLHPDRFATVGARERRIAAQKSAYLNEAYAVLMDTCSRADYLLKLRGCPINPNASLSNDDFLIKQMEYRERLEDAAAQPTATQAVALCNRIDKHSANINEQFECACDENLLDEAQSLLAQMRFMRKLKAEAKAIIATKKKLR